MCCRHASKFSVFTEKTTAVNSAAVSTCVSSRYVLRKYYRYTYSGNKSLLRLLSAGWLIAAMTATAKRHSKSFVLVMTETSTSRAHHEHITEMSLEAEHEPHSPGKQLEVLRVSGSSNTAHAPPLLSTKPVQSRNAQIPLGHRCVAKLDVIFVAKVIFRRTAENPPNRADDVSVVRATPLRRLARLDGRQQEDVSVQLWVLHEVNNRQGIWRRCEISYFRVSSDFLNFGHAHLRE